MHPHMIFGAALHLTALAVLGFFVLFAASKAQGLIKWIGNILGVWLFLLVVVVVVACATAPMFGGRPFGLAIGDHMSSGRMHHCRDDAQAAPPVEQAAPSPAPAADPGTDPN